MYGGVKYDKPLERKINYNFFLMTSPFASFIKVGKPIVGSEAEAEAAVAAEAEAEAAAEAAAEAEAVAARKGFEVS